MTDLTRILVIKLGAFGDFAMAMGPFRAIRDYHRAARITLLTTEPFAAWAKAGGWFDDVWTEGRPKTWSAFLALTQRLRGAGFERIYDLQTNRRTSLLFHLLRPNPPEWSGIAWGAAYPHANPRRDYMHALDAKREQLLMAGIADIPPTDVAWAQSLPLRFDIPKPFVLMVPGGSAHRPGKRWPIERYATLATGFVSQGLTPVILGGADEAALAAVILASAPDAHTLAGQTTFADIAALGRDAALAVGNDTGPMHLIAAAGAPSLVLFGAESSPELSAPKGADVRTLKAAQIADLTVEQVMGALPPRRAIP